MFKKFLESIGTQKKNLRRFQKILQTRRKKPEEVSEKFYSSRKFRKNFELKTKYCITKKLEKILNKSGSSKLL